MRKIKFQIISLYFYIIICNVFSQVLGDSLDITGSNDDTIVIGENSEDEVLHQPIKFTPDGLKCFFNHKFSHPKYVEDYLPLNFSDIFQFLGYAKETKQNKRFFNVTLRIFNQKFKALSYISAAEFTKLISKLPDLIEHLFISDSTQTNQTKIKNLLYNEFLNKYQFFKSDPINFFNSLSEQICQSFIKEAVDINDCSISELRATIIRFIETGLSKIVWFIEDEPDIWTQFKETCQAIYELKNKSNIIYNIEDINDLLHSALERFIFILDVRGSSLPEEFFEKMWQDILNNTLAWLDIEEIDELIEAKKNRLLRMIKKTHAKAIGQQRYGLIASV